MGEGTKIGIYFTSGSNWLGGVYYLINLVNSFGYLEVETELKPSFTIFYNGNSEDYIKLFRYDKIQFVKIPTLNNKKIFLKSILYGRNFFLTREILDSDIEALYPFNDFPVKTDSRIKLISWYPDLQHKFYPQYFSKLGLLQREFRLKKLLRYSENLVLSSKDVYSHFEKLYELDDVTTEVLPFVSLTDVENLTSENILSKKYKADSVYFMVSNQFYIHKDHKTLFEAIVILKSKGIEARFLMTGLMDDYRSPDYINSLKNIISENSLDSNIDLLGVIPRNDQLSLMKGSIAVIQPSLFEGWSTVIEDAKSLGAGIIASDIDIHREQLEDQGVLFQKGNAQDLARVISIVLQDYQQAKTGFKYNEHIENFSKSFLKIVADAK